jgi:transcriptional regulator with XRE-family HTH domain
VDDSRQQDLIPLGMAIRELRERRGMEARDLAVAAGVDPRRVEEVEAGRLDPSFRMLLRLAQSMGVRPSAFFIRAEQLSALKTNRE